MNRHYQVKYGNYQDDEILFEWRNAHQAYLKRLQVSCIVQSWYEFTHNRQFTEVYERLLADFETKKGLSDIINTVALKFTHKGELAQCRTYLLEECAGALLIDGYLTYPGELNGAIKYVLKNYGGRLQFISHTIGKVHAPAAQSSAAAALPPNSVFFAPQPLLCQSQFARAVAGMIDGFNLDGIDPQQRLWFMQQLLSMCAKFVKPAGSDGEIKSAYEMDVPVPTTPPECLVCSTSPPKSVTCSPPTPPTIIEGKEDAETTGSHCQRTTSYSSQ